MSKATREVARRWLSVVAADVTWAETIIDALTAHVLDELTASQKASAIGVGANTLAAAPNPKRRREFVGWVIRFENSGHWWWRVGSAATAGGTYRESQMATV